MITKLHQKTSIIMYAQVVTLNAVKKVITIDTLTPKNIKSCLMVTMM
jgi:hypothetical protein